MGPRIWLPSERSKGVNQRVLIYYVCGNPGLIEYYTDFLTDLRGLLDASEEETAYDIFGQNLLGFSDDDHEPFTKANVPWDLDGQIEGVYDDVAAKRVGQEAGGRPYDYVMLVGHSVGAYIAVEVFHRHMKTPSRAAHLRLRHGVLLFPTLTHIARSPSGARITTARRVLPVLDRTAHVGAQMVLSLVPQGALTWFTARLMGFTERCARVTAQWLKSRDGVWQAIHLGLSELEMIQEERWEEELWEVAEEAGEADEAEDDDGLEEPEKTPKFFLFYGRDDHWVANHLRDEFIRRRHEHAERGGGRTRIVVDEGKVAIPHAFCTREDTSYMVAKQVHEWIGETEGRRGDEKHL